jgi:hypothetical protein
VIDCRSESCLDLPVNLARVDFSKRHMDKSMANCQIGLIPGAGRRIPALPSFVSVRPTALIRK